MQGAICEGDTVLLCTNHFKRFFGTEHWNNGPGITAEATPVAGKQRNSGVWGRDHVAECTGDI